MRVFISQPMKDKSEQEILDNTKRIKKQLEVDFNEEVFIVPSFNSDALIKDVPLACLGNAITQLATADIAYFASGWKEARGCRIECLCALEYNVKTIFEDEICEDFPKE